MISKYVSIVAGLDINIEFQLVFWMSNSEIFLAQEMIPLTPLIKLVD